MARVKPTNKKREFSKAWDVANKKMRSDFFSLKDDQETADICFVGDPFTREEMARDGSMKTRAYFPILTKVGLQAWGTGKRVYNSIHSIWETSYGMIYTVTRHGGKNNTETRYEITEAEDQTKVFASLDAYPTEKELEDLAKRVLTTQQRNDDDDDN